MNTPIEKIKKWFKVKYGYSVADQVSISENELDKAIYAQREGIVVQLGNATIQGRNIISITPHWHKYTGWYDWYEPKEGDDFAQIKRDCPDFDGIIEEHKNYVSLLTDTRQIKQIGARDWENETPQEKLEASKDDRPLAEERKSLADKFKLS